MKKRFQRVFKKSQKIIIGSVHFPPLLGYHDFPGFEVAFKNAHQDIQAFERGGADATIIENNYDIPHKEKVDPPIVASMIQLGARLQEDAKKPMGINVLWNDYEAAFSIAKTLGLSFIRIPVFVDTVKTDCGKIIGDPKQVWEFRKKIGADDILLFADIHVKHAKLLSNYSLTQSTKRAFRFGADGVIITGDWTGQAPDMNQLRKVRRAIGSSRILFVGSGADKYNISEIFKYANAVIVSTSLKSGVSSDKEINVKHWNRRVQKKKVRIFVSAV